jgi:hypothetical protein
MLGAATVRSSGAIDGPGTQRQPSLYLRHPQQQRPNHPSQVQPEREVLDHFIQEATRKCSCPDTESDMPDGRPSPSPALVMLLLVTYRASEGDDRLCVQS